MQSYIVSAGFPDDHKCFLPFATKLAEQSDVFIGVTCLPGYHDSVEKPWRSYKPNGYSFEEMANAIREAVKVLESRSRYENTDTDAIAAGGVSVKPKLVGIFHDWGVVPGDMFMNRYREEHPHRKMEIVNFDVLGPPHPDMSKELIPKIAQATLYEAYIGLSYRTIFALLHLSQRYLPEIVARAVFIALMMWMNIFRLNPVFTKIETFPPSAIETPRLMYMAYPYVKMSQAMFTGKLKTIFQDFSLAKDLETTPMLYMYGREKRIMFHDHRSVKILQDQKGKSDAIGVDGAGHWLYTEAQKMDYCLEKVVEFIETD